MKKRISRNDVIFLAILLAVVTVFLVVYERTGTRADAGACVRVTVDGSVYGTYALGEDNECPDNPRWQGGHDGGGLPGQAVCSSEGNL